MDQVNAKPPKRSTVLVFPAGTEISFEILAALQHEKWIELVGAGMDASSHASFAFERYLHLPNVADPQWLQAITELCLREAIDFILPAHDDAIVALAGSAHVIPATIVSSPESVCEISRSKSLTYKALAGAIRTPRVYARDEALSFPVFVKPDRGQGSFNARLVRDQRELDAALHEIDDCLVCEHLPGEEYTVDCFSDREKGLLFAGARRRQRTRNGIAVNTVCMQLPEAQVLGGKIQDRLPFRGAWFFQIKRSKDGELALLEVAPRVAGSMAAHRVRGVNFPLLSLYEAMRIPVRLSVIDCEMEMDRALANRYRHNLDFGSVYVDLDDTLIVNGALNVDLVAFLHRCVGEGKPITLITRHDGDLVKTLARFRIADLFDRVEHLPAGALKSACMRGERPLFIDDSFREREEVARATGALCFDLSMMEMLYRRAPA